MKSIRGKVLITGSAGRVGVTIAAELLRAGIHVVMMDVVPQQRMSQLAGRLNNDAWLATGTAAGQVSVYGDFDVLDEENLATVLATERPELVINYAIPITWDATKRLANYAAVSAAGLGAFTPIQVLAPLSVARAIARSGLDARLMVGNLPDITAPVITAMANSEDIPRPVCGAGNVGLNQIAFRRQLALEHGVPMAEVELKLVSHHVHWVAPREPGYSNVEPFLASIRIAGQNPGGELEDLRALMNRGVNAHYEAGAEFSSTTGILASRVALALLDDSDTIHHLHAPAPQGLPGGYPVQIKGGQVSLDLAPHWQLDEAVAAMQRCQLADGVADIAADGSVEFSALAIDILQRELGFELPQVMAPRDIEQVAREQIAVLQRAFSQA